MALSALTILNNLTVLLSAACCCLPGAPATPRRPQSVAQCALLLLLSRGREVRSSPRDTLQQQQQQHEHIVTRCCEHTSATSPSPLPTNLPGEVLSRADDVCETLDACRRKLL